MRGAISIISSLTNSPDVLVIPTRVVSRISDLSTSEASSLFSSVQAVGRIVEKAYNADALTIACQVCDPFIQCIASHIDL